MGQLSRIVVTLEADALAARIIDTLLHGAAGNPGQSASR
jgi:hypothetical protein